MNLSFDANEEHHEPRPAERSSPRPTRGRYSVEGAPRFSRTTSGGGGVKNKAPISRPISRTRSKSGPRRTRSKSMSTDVAAAAPMEDVSSQSAMAALPSSTRRGRNSNKAPALSRSATTTTNTAAPTKLRRKRQKPGVKPDHQLHASMPAMSFDHAARPKRVSSRAEQQSIGSSTSKPTTSRKSPPRHAQQQHRKRSPSIGEEARGSRRTSDRQRRASRDQHHDTTDTTPTPRTKRKQRVQARNKNRQLQQSSSSRMSFGSSSTMQDSSRMSQAPSLLLQDSTTSRTTLMQDSSRMSYTSSSLQDSSRISSSRMQDSSRTSSLLLQDSSRNTLLQDSSRMSYTTNSSMQDSSRISYTSLPTNLTLYAEEAQATARKARAQADDKWVKQFGRLSVAGQMFLEGNSKPRTSSTSVAPSLNQSSVDFLNSLSKLGVDDTEEEFDVKQQPPPSTEYNNKLQESDPIIGLRLSQDDSDDVPTLLRKVKSESSVQSAAKATKQSTKKPKDRSSKRRSTRKIKKAKKEEPPPLIKQTDLVERDTAEGSTKKVYSSMDEDDDIVSMPPARSIVSGGERSMPLPTTIHNSDPLAAKPKKKGTKTSSNKKEEKRQSKKAKEEKKRLDKQEAEEPNTLPTTKATVAAAMVQQPPPPQQQRRASRPVNELSTFLNQYDDLDALFSQGIQEAVAMEKASSNSKDKSGGSPVSNTEGAVVGGDFGLSPATLGSSKPLKRRSRPGEVLKRFMKNFDDLDILFSRKLIKPATSVDEKSNSKGSRSKNSKNSKLSASSAHEIGSAHTGSLLSPSYQRRSLPNLTELEKGKNSPKSSPKSPNQSSPNILMEMLEMSDDDLKDLFAKQKKSGKPESFDLTDIAEANDGSPNRNSLTQHTALSRVSEEPPTGNYGHQSTSSLDLYDFCQMPFGDELSEKEQPEPVSEEEEQEPVSEIDPSSKQEQPPSRGKSASGARSSLTLEDLITPELEDDTDEDEDPKKRDSVRQSDTKTDQFMSQSDRTHDVRRTSQGENVMGTQSDLTHDVRRSSHNEKEMIASGAELRRAAPIRRRVERSLSPPRRPRQRRATDPISMKAEKQKAVQKPERRSLPGGLGDSCRSLSHRSLSPRPRQSDDLGESSRSLSSQRSMSARPRPRQKVVPQDHAPGESTKPERGRRSLPARLKHGQRSLSPARRPVSKEPGTTQPEEDRAPHLSRRSLPTHVVDKAPESPDRRSSQGVDVLKSLMDRYDDHEELYTSGLEEAAAPITEVDFDIDHEAIEAMKAAKEAKERAQGPKRTDQEEGEKPLSPSNEPEAGRRGRTLDGGRRGFPDRSPKSPRRVPTKATNQVSRGERDKSPSTGKHLKKSTPITAEVAVPSESSAREQTEEAQDADDGISAASAEAPPPLPAIVVEKKTVDTSPLFPYVGEAGLDLDRVDPSLYSGSLGMDQMGSTVGSKSTLDDFLTNEARGQGNRRPRHQALDDGHASLPTRFSAVHHHAKRMGRTRGSSRYSPDEAIGFALDDMSWQHYDEAQSVYSDLSGRPHSDLRGYSYPRENMPVQRPRRHRSPWVDHQYFGAGEDVYYSHPNLGYGRSMHESFPTIHELEAQHYASHSHLTTGRPDMHSSAHLLSFQQGHLHDPFRGHYNEENEMARRTSRGGEHLSPRYRGSGRFDAGKSMSLEDVFGRSNHEAATQHRRHIGKTDHSHRSHRDITSRSGSERRLSSSVHGQEVEWQDFTEVARSGALQSIPWRNTRGLSVQLRLIEAEEARKMSSLRLDDSFHCTVVSKGCPRSNNEFCCGVDCCCQKNCSPPWYHRPAQGMMPGEEKEKDEEPSHRGRTVQALAKIAASAELDINRPPANDDESSITYPIYKPDVDERVPRRSSGGTLLGDEDTLLSFAL
ncbi:expressed unknown protein [Seminavis robusta]|uniref:Uncharacterized protein n=1 Tax=Seminavis robusta TaxID=568900 RepID=A0A9N8EBA2_9STRA|nr:expressed unknown protein [Seminavis robusta]|eukprot:Sro761_g198500.1 n/a (1877) ;mRNA; r:12839-18469